MRALDDPLRRSVAVADPARLLDGPRPVLLDEWQLVPECWDLVRRAVDAGAEPGQFLLTGSMLTAGGARGTLGRAGDPARRDLARRPVRIAGDAFRARLCAGGGGNVRHLRTIRGEHEIDLIVERADGRVLAIEVKLARDAQPSDVAQLKWLADRIGGELLDAVVVTTGPEAYRRDDGIAVIPAALLGP